MAQPATIEVAQPTRPRLQLVDLWRGAALLAMVVYHFAWDLSYYELIAADLTTHPFWVTLQRSILSSFLLLVGIGLVLAHRNGVRWPSFWRRFAAIAAAALAVTAGTFWMFPDYFVYFGILHAIALFSLLALPFLRLRPVLVLAAAAAFMLPPLLWSSPDFAARPLAWIGLWSVLPETTDIVPVLPWFGVVLIGVAGARMALATPLAARLAQWRPPGPLSRLLIGAGRKSLLVYLVHQPLLLGALALYLQLAPTALQPEVLSRRQTFVRSCEATCAADHAAAYCTSYCGCALEQVEAADLWALLDRPGPERDAALAPLATLCSAMAE